MKRFQQDMLKGPLLANIIVYSVPIILTSLLQLLFNAADLVVVGQFCGSLSVGAVGATGAIINLIVNLFMGLSVGAGVTTAHALGSRAQASVHRTVHTAMPAALVSGAVLTVVGIILTKPLLMLMGTPDNVLNLSVTYMRIYFGGITFNMVYNFAAAILRAAGDTKGPLIYLSIAGVFNVLLNLFFVAVLKMNVDGVALATTLSQGLSAVLVVRALMRRTDGCRFSWRQMRFYKTQLLKIIRLGVPAGLQGTMFSISNVLIQSSINSFGDIVLSGSAAAANLEGFAYVAMNAFHQSALNFTGQNMGAGQYKRVRKIMWTCLGCVVVVGVVFSNALYLLGPKLLPIYLSDSPEAVTYGLMRMGFVCVPYFILGMSDVLSGVLRGMGESIRPMLISVFSICGIRVAWIYTIFRMEQFHTFSSLLLSYPISWLIAFVLNMILFVWVINKWQRCSAETPRVGA